MEVTTSSEAWLEEGLRLLGEAGIGGVTIDAVAARVGLTKGSFYHHFGDRNGFAEDLLRHWERTGTLRPIEVTAGASAAEALEMLSALAVEVAQSPEVAIRAWALRDPLARRYQQRVDAQRLAYLSALVRRLVEDEARAEVVARIFMATYVGAQQVVPAMGSEQLREMLAELRQRLL